jgi:hypothetical protein
MTDAADQHAGPDVQQRPGADRLHDRKRCSEIERLYAELIDARAPATEGPIVNRGRLRTGRLVFGDATE